MSGEAELREGRSQAGERRNEIPKRFPPSKRQKPLTDPWALMLQLNNENEEVPRSPSYVHWPLLENKHKE
jgi:hypothetical protein